MIETEIPLSAFTESILFKFLKDNFFPGLVRSKKKFSRWDCYDVYGFNRIEMKCRKRHFDTILIERIKYDAMIKTCDDHLDTPLFIVSTPKGIYCWNLRKTTFNWEVNSRNPASTFWGNGERVTKEVAYININESVKLI